MSRKTKLLLVEFAAILAITNIILWWIPFNRLPAFWVGYGLIMIAAIEMFVARYMSYARGDIKHRFFNFPLYYIMYGCAAFLVIAGLIFVIFNTISVKVALIISALLLLLNLLSLIWLDKAREESSVVEKKAKMKSFYISSLEQKIRSMIEPSMDTQLKRELEKLADDIHYSDPMSSEVLASIESEIQDGCEKLEMEVEDPVFALDTCKRLRKLVQTRNEKCALLK